MDKFLFPQIFQKPHTTYLEPIRQTVMQRDGVCWEFTSLSFTLSVSRHRGHGPVTLRSLSIFPCQACHSSPAAALVSPSSSPPHSFSLLLFLFISSLHFARYQFFMYLFSLLQFLFFFFVLGVLYSSVFLYC